jgi:aminoglycoside phosphotransferase (APT) family kinase protein
MTVRHDPVADYRSRVLAHLQHVYGPDARISCVSTRALGYSISFRFVVDTRHGPVVGLYAKVRRVSKFGGYEAVDPGSKTARLGRLEYQTLQRAHDWFSTHTPDLGVVRPVAYVEDCQALVVTAAEGMALDQIVRLQHPLQLAAVTRSGRWLRHFHDDVDTATTRGWEAGAFTSRLGKVCGALREAGADAEVIAGLERRIVAQARRFDGRPAVHALVHGDFKLRHIWTTPTRMEVLDFGNVHTAPVVEDLAAFLVELEVAEFGAVRSSSPGATALAAAFLDGYGPIATPGTLALQLTLARLKKWARRRHKPSASSAARGVQQLLKLTGTDELARRQLIDPWFLARIETEIAWLERHDVAAGPSIPYTGTLAVAVDLPASQEPA